MRVRSVRWLRVCWDVSSCEVGPNSSSTIVPGDRRPARRVEVPTPRPASGSAATWQRDDRVAVRDRLLIFTS